MAAPQHAVNGIVSYVTEDRKYRLSISAYNGFLNFDVFPLSRDEGPSNGPFMKVRLLDDMVTVLLGGLEQALTVKESRSWHADANYFDKDVMEWKYEGTMKLDVDYQNRICIGLCSAKNKDMLFFPLASSGIESVCPNGQQPDLWTKTRMGVKALLRKFDKDIPQIVVSTRLNRQENPEYQRGGNGGGGSQAPAAPPASGGTGQDVPF